MIDIHAHYLSPRLLAPNASGSSRVSFDRNREALVFPSGPSRPIRSELTDLDLRRRWMTARAIELQLVSPWMDVGGDDLETTAATAWCRTYNDMTADDLSGASEFRAMALLPVVSGAAAAGELARSVGELGFVGGAVPTQVAGTDLDVAGLDPLFEAAQDLDVPLFVHPFRVMARERMSEHFLFNVCGNPFETTLAAMRLFWSGTFERWPRLKLILAHAGGVLPVLAARAWHASNHVPGFDKPIADPGVILGSFYYDTLLHDASALSQAIGSVGRSRVMGGTDAPFPMLLDDPVAHIRRACDLAGLDETAADEILTGNAEQLFRL